MKRIALALTVLLFAMSLRAANPVPTSGAIIPGDVGILLGNNTNEYEGILVYRDGRPFYFDGMLWHGLAATNETTYIDTMVTNTPFALLTGIPTSISGYGITNDLVYGNDSRLTDDRDPNAHSQAWSTVTSTPISVAGYGITNDFVYATDSRLTDARTPNAHTQSWTTISGLPTTIQNLAPGTSSNITVFTNTSLVHVRAPGVYTGQFTGTGTGLLDSAYSTNTASVLIEGQDSVLRLASTSNGYYAGRIELARNTASGIDSMWSIAQTTQPITNRAGYETADLAYTNVIPGTTFQIRRSGSAETSQTFPGLRISVNPSNAVGYDVEVGGTFRMHSGVYTNWGMVPARPLPGQLFNSGERIFKFDASLDDWVTIDGGAIAGTDADFFNSGDNIYHEGINIPSNAPISPARVMFTAQGDNTNGNKGKALGTLDTSKTTPAGITDKVHNSRRPKYPERAVYGNAPVYIRVTAAPSTKADLPLGATLNVQAPVQIFSKGLLICPTNYGLDSATSTTITSYVGDWVSGETYDVYGYR